MVKVITSLVEIPQDKRVVIDFFADWCGPCKKIAPEYEKLSQKYADIVFLKIDADESDKLAESFNINALPTFLFELVSLQHGTPHLAQGQYQFG